MKRALKIRAVIIILSTLIALPALAQEKTRILIVPGHEPYYGGAEFGAIKERNLVAELGADLQKFLKADNTFESYITRSAWSWNPVFADYFNNNWDAIAAWEKSSRHNGTRQLSIESLTVPKIVHLRAPPGVALRLYGITKWANDNNIYLTLHLHLNDDGDHPVWAPGQYSGLAIYVPASPYINSTTTRRIAAALLNRFSKYDPISDLPGETSGIISDPDLIAIGANNTANSASMLIEYDYIYQPQFTNPRIRSLALNDLAYQTSLGLQDFFAASSTPAKYIPSSLYEWSVPAKNRYSDPKDIYALQTALLLDGDFPPAGKTMNDCPHSGIFGVCTKTAVKEFQDKNGITGEKADGAHTFELLQRIYNRD